MIGKFCHDGIGREFTHVKFVSRSLSAIVSFNYPVWSARNYDNSLLLLSKRRNRFEEKVL